MAKAVRASVVTVLCAGALVGCGDGNGGGLLQDARQRAEQVRERAQELRDRARELRERVLRRVREVLAQLEQVVPAAGPQTLSPGSEGRTRAGTIDGFLTEVLRSIDRYWTQTFAAAGLPEPRVSYLWVAPGTPVRTACGAVADDSAAFYCPADDTIYVAQVLAARLYRGIIDDFPGQRAGYGRAVGDFGVAYLVAHEYAHNLQSELGAFRGRLSASKPFELQADCMAGLWGNSVYRAGKLEPGDVQEAMGTALAVGDFDLGAREHHGTPEERRDAWVLGFRSGDPGACRRYTA